MRSVIMLAFAALIFTTMASEAQASNARCVQSDGSMCVEGSKASKPLGMLFPEYCKSIDGVLETGACPKANHVGTCIWMSKTPNPVKARYYSPKANAEQVKMFCAMFDSAYSSKY